MKVYVGVGHGHRSDGTFDPGAVGGGWTEQSAGDYIVHQIAKLLRAAGFEVKDEAFQRDPNFPGTTRAANAWGADVVVEVHHDWSGAPDGAFGHWISQAGKAVADDIQQAVGRAGFLLRPSWHKRRTDLYILKHTNAPCVLYEVGKIGSQHLNTEKELRMMGSAIARGIMDWAGVAAPEEPQEPEEDDVLKRGDKGPKVDYFQRRINDALGVEPGEPGSIAEDGDFGPATEDAVKRIQANVGFFEDGVLDMSTAIYTQALAHSKKTQGSGGLSRVEADKLYAAKGATITLQGRLP